MNIIQRLRALSPNAWGRWILGLLIILVLAYIAFNQRDFLQEGTAHVLSANNWWVLTAATLAFLSMVFMALMMQTLLNAAGLNTTLKQTLGLSLVSNSWSTTLPAGAAISGAMVFREQFKWGATPVIAGWYLILSGLLQAAGLASIGLIAFFLLGASLNPYTLWLSIFTLLAVLVGIRWLTKNIHFVEKCVLAVLYRWNKFTKKPRETHVEVIKESLAQFSAVSVSPRTIACAFLYSTLNWIADLLCVFACIWALDAHFSTPGVILSFVTAKLVATAQITPGGLGTVDAALTGSLVALGSLPYSVAFAVVFTYRMITLVGLNLLGWCVLLVHNLPGFHKHPIQDTHNSGRGFLTEPSALELEEQDAGIQITPEVIAESPIPKQEEE